MPYRNNFEKGGWGGGTPGGALVKILIGMLVSFFGVEIYENVIFWVSLSWRHFFGVEKIGVIFLGSLKICVIFLGY